jgi:diguanylate cyclase (GGDEF)-like protein
MTDPTLAALLEVAEEGFLVFESDQGETRRCTLASARLSELFGGDGAALVGQPESSVLAKLAGSCEDPTAFDARMALAHREPQAFELEVGRTAPRTLRVHTRIVANGWLGVVRDVSRERSAERRANQLLTRLEQLTATDALTQLPNRRRFHEELEREHGRASRAWDSYAVLRIDVDDLASVNAKLGTPRGDEALEQVAERLRRGRREYDLLARLDGDEFVLLVPGADATAAQVIAQRIAEAVCAEPLRLTEPWTMSVCVGGAVWVPPSGESGADVLARAGAALETAQAVGANRIELS